METENITRVVRYFDLMLDKECKAEIPNKSFGRKKQTRQDSWSSTWRRLSESVKDWFDATQTKK